MTANFSQGLTLVEQCQTHFANWLPKLIAEPDNPSLIHHSEKLVIIINQLVKQHPLLSLSLLQCPRQSWPWSYRYIFHFALLTCQLASCNQWHEKSTETLLKACLLIYRKRIIPLEKWAKAITLNNSDKMHLLSSAVLPHTCSGTSSLLKTLLALPVHSLLLSRTLQHDSGLKQYHSVLMISSQLALLITPGGKRQTYSMAKACKLLARMLPPSQYQLLNSLLHITGVNFPASPCLIRQQKHYLLATLKTNHLALAQPIEHKVRVSLLPPTQLDMSEFTAPAALENSSAHLQQLWPAGWQREKYPSINKTYRLAPMHYRLDFPPPALADFRQQLQQAEPDTWILTRLIESEQQLAKYMCLQAEVRSRLHIKIQQVKQALLVQGFERSFHILSQQALCVRLYQYRFPSFEMLQQLTQWHAAIASQLASVTQLNLMSEEVQSAIHFYHAGLFISPQVKCCYPLELTDYVVFTTQSLFKGLKLSNVIDTSIKLGEYWRQPSTVLAAFRLTGNHHQTHSSHSVMKLAAVIQLSMALTQQTLRFGKLNNAFFGNPTTQSMMQQCTLSERQLITIVNDALIIFSPQLPLQ